jgi:hypothetical protein
MAMVDTPAAIMAVAVDIATKIIKEKTPRIFTRSVFSFLLRSK